MKRQSIYVVKEADQCLKGLTSEQENILKDLLTFDNPAYKNAKRYSKNRYITIPPYLTFYGYGNLSDKFGEKCRYMIVPIGVDLNSVFSDCDIKVIDRREYRGSFFVDDPDRKAVSYPKFVMELREGQKKAADAWESEQKKHYPRNIVHLPTGKGKTVLALYLASKWCQKTLVLVHKDDLVTGWQKDIHIAFNGQLKPGLIKAKSRTVGEQITIATVQTLSRMSQVELSSYLDQFGFVICDEVHHVGATMFNIIGKFNARLKLGLSATPKRSDGLDFCFDIFLGGVGYKYEYTAEDDDILPVRVIIKDAMSKFKPFLYEGQVFNSYDFKERELPPHPKYLENIPYEQRPTVPFFTADSSVVLNRRYIIQVCHDILSEYRQGRSCVAFFSQKEHVRRYWLYLSEFVNKDELLLYYGDSTESSKSMIDRLESRECRITLATYKKAQEGTNVRAWEVGFLVSSMSDDKNVEQTVGRIRRRDENKVDCAILYDYRFPDSMSLKNHGAVRDVVYRRLKFKIEDYSTPVRRTGCSMFSRGFSI